MVEQYTVIIAGDSIVENKGDSAYAVAVSNGFVGTEEEWLESITGPEGPMGPQGNQGVQGIQGIQGETGPIGPEGPQGNQGIQGDVGPQGIGLKAMPGVDLIADLPVVGNEVGDLRVVQEDGDWYVWSGSVWENVGQIVGPQGIQGIQGIQGPKGDIGDQGIQGIKGDQGIEGPQGPQGNKGDKGDKGDTGPEAALPNTICHIQHRGTTTPYAWPTRTTQPGYVMWVDGTNQEPTDPSDWVIGDIIFDSGTGV